MAFNFASFRTRAITALVFVAVMLLGTLWNIWSFLVLFSIIHFGCWMEFQRLVEQIHPEYAGINPIHRYGVMIAGWAMILYATGDALSLGGISLQDIGYWSFLLLIFVILFFDVLYPRKLNLRSLAYSLFGLLYISLGLALFTNMRVIFFHSKLSLILVLMVIASLWINDTLAYLVGSWIGRTPMTSISPRKTWEGTIAGILLSVTIMACVGYLVSTEFDWEAIRQWMGVAAISSVMGTFGDLLESKLKRMAGVKDSGQIMPGHGGFLDRFDSLLAAAPFVWIFVVSVIRP